MVAIALVAESLSFVIEFLGCVMAIFYRIWARAVSTSWRGALHHLYTRPFWHEWNVYCCVSATAPATAATASASGDDHTEKLWTSSYLNAPSCHGYLLSNIHKDIVKLVKLMRDICFSCPGARMQSNDLWRPCMFRQTWECISIKIHLSGAPLNSDPPAKRSCFQNWCSDCLVLLYCIFIALQLAYTSVACGTLSWASHSLTHWMFLKNISHCEMVSSGCSCGHSKRLPRQCFLEILMEQTFGFVAIALLQFWHTQTIPMRSSLWKTLSSTWCPGTLCSWPILP